MRKYGPQFAAQILRGTLRVRFQVRIPGNHLFCCIVRIVSKSRERMEAERIARNHLEYHLDGRCALIYLTRDEIEQSRVDPADLEELTSLPISIEGVKVGLTLRQQPGGSYRISVRTAKGVDACAIARRLGGGGHTRAAGCELLGNLDNAKSAILSEVEAVLDAPQEEA